MTELKCTRYVEGDWVEEGLWPCHCPVCGGFLSWDEHWLTEELIPICNKCGTELMAIPEKIDGEEMEWGKICPISKPKKDYAPSLPKPSQTP